jgi:hypothetical protein
VGWLVRLLFAAPAAAGIYGVYIAWFASLSQLDPGHGTVTGTAVMGIAFNVSMITVMLIYRPALVPVHLCRVHRRLSHDVSAAACGATDHRHLGTQQHTGRGHVGFIGVGAGLAPDGATLGFGAFRAREENRGLRSGLQRMAWWRDLARIEKPTPPAMPEIADAIPAWANPDGIEDTKT